jgi:hypothetical protein
VGHADQPECIVAHASQLGFPTYENDNEIDRTESRTHRLKHRQVSRGFAVKEGSTSVIIGADIADHIQQKRSPQFLRDLQEPLQISRCGTQRNGNRSARGVWNRGRGACCERPAFLKARDRKSSGGRGQDDCTERPTVRKSQPRDFAEASSNPR